MSIRYTDDEICRRGEELYKDKIQAQVESGNVGRYLAIDIETGEYELGEEQLEPAKKILARHPDALLFGMRIGYPAPVRLGGRFGPQVRPAP